MPTLKFKGNEMLELIGDKKLIKEIKSFGNIKIRRIMRKAIKPALTPIARQARANVPVKSGELKRAISKKVGKRGAWGKVYVRSTGTIRIQGEGETKVNPARYAHLVEFGTSVAEAKPFLVPALDSQKAVAMVILANKARKAIDQIYAKA